MKEFVRQQKIKELLALRGRIEVEDITKELEKLELVEMKENDKRWHSR